MTAALCNLYDAYSQIVTDCYPACEANIKMICAKYLNEYCRKRRITISLADEHFFDDFFIKWLPYNVCTEDKSIIEAFYTTADEYVRLTDMLNGTSIHSRFKRIKPLVKCESQRLMLLKKKILEYNDSFIISKLPVIIDFYKYKTKKSSDSEEYEHDRGKFAVKSIFSENSVVLSKLNGYDYYIRLFFDKNIVELIREDDIFDISIVKKGQAGKWMLDEINGCYSNRGLI